MQHFNTLNDLIYFAYNEPELSGDSEYQKIIGTNKYLNREYETIVKAREKLRKLKVGPSESVIKNIMSYSKALSVSPSKSAGNISLLLN